MTTKLVCLDWGDTVMKVFPYDGPMSTWPEVEAVGGVREALAALTRPGVGGAAAGNPPAGFRVALLTNAGESTEAQVWEALARVGLDGYFEAVVLSREVGVPKTQPAFYEKALAILEKTLALPGLRPEEAVMIGDNYENDVVAAKGAGLKAVWFAPRTSASGRPAGPAPVPPGEAHDAILRDMRLMPEIVRRL